MVVGNEITPDRKENTELEMRKCDSVYESTVICIGEVQVTGGYHGRMTGKGFIYLQSADPCFEVDINKDRLKRYQVIKLLLNSGIFCISQNAN